MNTVELFEKERAAGYNQFVETWIPNYTYFLDCLPQLLEATERKDLLVVGCGTGNEIERFVKAPSHWAITGVDPSPEMIAQAKVKLQDYTEVQLVEGLLSMLNTEKTFSAATLLLVLHFLEDNGDKLNLLRDIADRLESGAPLVLLDITGTAKQMEQNLHILRLLLPAGLDKTEINKRMNRIQNELHAVSEERLAILLYEAGFEEPTRFFQSAIYMGWLTKKR